ncbi:cell division protein ZipA [Acinetobacter sp. Ac_877]|uniref:cell division protein ZipA C-terminal FtsZ-binding domain-containing protein n=1 Tax=Acinetobacter portensis TaxID=1839785 RepID=UPI00128E935B|nr:cell division protein ZipA C-terminal FtsZ-binding domain-containing protein [Acinetobacter portensis]MPW40202.1 cell division protein ZipA [Acinetobacter portensis]
MEITTIVGIAIAVIIIVIGLKLLLKKPRDTAPSLESELQFNEDSQKPIIPRHVRDQLQLADSEETVRVEPTLDAKQVQTEFEFDKAEPKLNEEKLAENTSKVTQEKAEVKVEESSKKTEVEDGLSAEVEVPANEPVATSETKAESSFTLNSNIEKAEISEFEEESSILDAHLYEQKVVDDECALVTAESFIAFNVVYKGRVLSGEKTLKVLLKYGLRFGEMKCFHRYNEDGTKLLFSALQITDTGTEGFDLETLSTEEVKGLALFLALPHSDVQNAFDTMVSIAGLIAREIDGTVYDQNDFELTPQLREYWRHQAIDYRSDQTAKV